MSTSREYATNIDYTKAIMASTMSIGEYNNPGRTRYNPMAMSSGAYDNCSTQIGTASSGGGYFDLPGQQLQALMQQRQIQQQASPAPKLAAATQPGKAHHMFKDFFGDIRGYMKDNRDLIFSLVFVLVLDEYIFGGVFRERIKAIVEGFLKKVEDKTHLTAPPAVPPVIQ